MQPWGSGQYIDWVKVFVESPEEFRSVRQIDFGNFTVAAVPEASTWAMMIMGFAGVGFMAYRGRTDPTSFRIA
jgi:hypothetical protein